MRSFGGGDSVLVWAGIAHGFRTNLVVIEGTMNAQRYRDEIFARHVILLFRNNANITPFQNHNATSRTARATVNFLRANRILFIDDWPAKSSNMNPSEHLWDKLDQCLRRCPIPLSNVIQLRQALIRE